MVTQDGESSRIFTQLCLGLLIYIEDHEYKSAYVYPPGLMLAMNHLALSMEGKFPKTWREFIVMCGKPLKEWYPDPITIEEFGGSYRLLKNGTLTEAVQDYLNDLPPALVEEQYARGFIPQSVLDNQAMVDLINRLHAWEDRSAAQREYVATRSFLIEHCWIGRPAERKLEKCGLSSGTADNIIRNFYRTGSGNLWECERCGVLRVDGDRLIGVKPSYCDDHRPELPHVHQVDEYNFQQLNVGTHLRTFIPGRAELAIFEAAERLHDDYPDVLTEVERYPGLDSYDLRLVFTDEIWAVDVKDIADPRAMAKKITPLKNDGALTHDRGYYVIPDRRLVQQPDYLINVARHTAAIKPPLLSLLGQNEFCERMENKCKSLLKTRR